MAVGAGSRGLTGRVELVRGTVRGLRELGAEPFVVPAMGSHGGATADGQRHMLAELGITEETVGAEIKATMEELKEAIATLGPEGEINEDVKKTLEELRAALASIKAVADLIENKPNALIFGKGREKKDKEDEEPSGGPRSKR